MPVLLHIAASARSDSYSRELGEAFTAAWQTAHPAGTYVLRDLRTDPVPQIDEAWTELCDHVLRHGITDIDRYEEAVRGPDQARAWEVLRPLLAELVAADVVLITTPMYNFSVPASLKAWIDQVTFPKMSLAGRRFVIASARGGAYGPGTPREPYDHQERYLRDFLAGHFAIDDPVFLSTELVNSRIDPSLAARRAQHDESRAAALAAARELGGGIL
ncbi:NAD(P)H-dependent oxidoreductase [Streptomyces sp. NPDC006510]|uniref:FMN-dependent NADH-azoreductase n=1 Tax=Streptomyces sp. NPDC006510 TaxID=3155600 RepID=UPI0033A167A9